MWLLMSLMSAALAGPVDDSLAKAKAAVVAKDPKAAMAACVEAEAAAVAEGAVVMAEPLARIHFYRGLALRQMADKKGKDLDAFRAALAIDSRFVWDEAVLKDDTAQDLFEALRAEVRDRKKVDPGVPEKTGAAKVFVDGTRVKMGDTVLTGRHLGQIQCPDGVVKGVWTDFSKPVNWFKMCPGGVDTTVVVADASTDEFGDMGPAFGDEGGTPAVADAVSPTDGTAPTDGAGGPKIIYERRKITWPLLVGAGVTGLAAGGLHLVAKGHQADYLDLSNPSITRSELDTLRDKANKTEWAAIGVAGLATGLYVSAFIQW